MSKPKSRWRVLVFSKGKEVWYEAQVRPRLFWRTLDRDGYTVGEWNSPAKLDSPKKARELALLGVERYKKTHRAVFAEDTP